MNGHTLFQRGDNNEIADLNNSSSQEPLGQLQVNFAQSNLKGEGNFSLFN